MRLWGPVVSIVAIVLFVATMVSAVLLTLLVPVIGAALCILGISMLQPVVAVRSLEMVYGGLVQAWDTLRFMVTAMAHPLRPQVHTVQPDGLPDLMRVVDSVAEVIGQRSISGVILSPEPDFGVITVRTSRGLETYLLAGAPLLFVVTIDELRAIIAHELAHVALGHTGWSRMLGRWREMMVALTEGAIGWHPVSLALKLSASIFIAASLPWSRRDELDADALAGRAVGASLLVAALRKVDASAMGLWLSMLKVKMTSERTGIGPESWIEASLRDYDALPAMARMELKRVARGDPFDIDGCTHPPTPQRVAALGGGRSSSPPDQQRAIALLPDVRALERKLTRKMLRARRWTSARTSREETAPARVESRLLQDVGATTGYAELDLDVE